MKDQQKLTSITISDINLWAHVGVLEDERLLGQSFLLDIVIWIDINKSFFDNYESY